MGRAPCCDKATVKKGPWSPEEDAKLKEHIEKHGTGGNWIALPQKAGLKRCGKSCRLRWLNYLRPNIRHGDFTQEEDRIICSLFASIGSRWSVIAAHLNGRTDNDIKNYWNTKLKKKLMTTMAPPTTTNTTSKRSSSSSSTSSSSSSSSSSHNNTTTMVNIPLCLSSSTNLSSSQRHHHPQASMMMMMMEMMMDHSNDNHHQGMGNLVNLPYNYGLDDDFITMRSYHEDQENQTNNGLLLWSSSTSDGAGGSSSTAAAASTVTAVEHESMNPLIMEDYGLEEIKQLISCSTSGNYGNNNNSLWFDEDKKEDNKFMLYY